METLNSIQVLTRESILKIEIMIVHLEVYMEHFPNDRVLKNVNEVKELIQEIKSE